jgi:hypothetical protein
VQIISIVSKQAFCGQMFKDFSIIPVFSVHILKVVYYVRMYKETVGQNVHFWNYNIRKCWISMFSSVKRSFEAKHSECGNWALKNWTRTNLLKGS